ncbi:MAG: glycoside hydrolase 43 family protein [Opitutus sp.]
MTLLASSVPTLSASAQGVWQPDLGNGSYKNPVLYADYSDPDAIRVGDDYWMTSSSFSHVPGLPILHSKDLVNWELVAHALPRLVPADAFATPQPGKGVWAPSIRFHAGRYWIYYPDPDFGLYVITAADPRGPWTEPVLVRAGRGLIDPCPLWDDDGSVYLIHGWAKSRAGVSNILTLLRLADDGRNVRDDFGIVVDGQKLAHYTTLEGPKFYKRNGWYYIFAPAGGVKTGWQSVFRSRSIRGPYEDRIVLAQGTTPVNGPHQGALVDTPAGDSWFLHFQDKEAYGRIVHLQPVTWTNDWPVIGADPDHDGRGEPVLMHAKPVQSSARSSEPATSDEFASAGLGLQWQWQANPREEWFSLTLRPGFLRLVAQPIGRENLFRTPHLLLQKFPAPAFTATTQLEFSAADGEDATGLIIFGYSYGWIGVRGGRIVQVVVRDAHEKAVATETLGPPVTGPVHLRVTVTEGGRCQFAYSPDEREFTPLGAPFVATVSRWVGAKVGIFAAGAGSSVADYAWFRVTPAISE